MISPGTAIGIAGGQETVSVERTLPSDLSVGISSSSEKDATLMETAEIGSAGKGGVLEIFVFLGSEMSAVLRVLRSSSEFFGVGIRTR